MLKPERAERFRRVEVPVFVRELGFRQPRMADRDEVLRPPLVEVLPGEGLRL